MAGDGGLSSEREKNLRGNGHFSNFRCGKIMRFLNLGSKCNKT